MKIPIPPFLAHLPVEERGYPVPFFVPYKDGKPVFRLVDGDRIIDCFKRKLCGICGKRLDKKNFWFASGKMGLKNQVSSDAWMHERCVRYALAVCPYLLNQNADRIITEGKHDDIIINDKPDTMYAIMADKAEWYDDGKHKLFRYRAVRAHEFKYVDKKLTETGVVVRPGITNKLKK